MFPLLIGRGLQMGCARDPDIGHDPNRGGHVRDANGQVLKGFEARFAPGPGVVSKRVEAYVQGSEVLCLSLQIKTADLCGHTRHRGGLPARTNNEQPKRGTTPRGFQCWEQRLEVRVCAVGADPPHCR